LTLIRKLLLISVVLIIAIVLWFVFSGLFNDAKIKQKTIQKTFFSIIIAKKYNSLILNEKKCAYMIHTYQLYLYLCRVKQKTNETKGN
jgi:hypothetical protein